MGLKRGKTAVGLVLVAAATVGAADLFRLPGETGDHIERAHADAPFDPEAPIATARYREPSAQALAAAGLAPAAAPDAAEPPVVRLDDPASPAAQADTYQIARVSAPARVRVRAAIASQTGSAFQAPDPDALAALSLASDRRVTPGRDVDGRSTVGDDAKALLVKIAPSQEDLRRGHWFIFAASSGKAFGLNLVRDTDAGLRRAGWSVERLATLGKGQIGVGWRRGGLQASLAVAQREIGDLGVKVDDTLAGFTLSWRRPDDR
jgi:hypothetical protein